MSREFPIIFSGPMVRSILSGAKSQTRRVVRKQFAADAIVAEVGATSAEGWQVSGHSGLWWDDAGACLEDAVRCPYGMPGDRLWVRETFAKIDGQTQPWIETDYRATYTQGDRLGDSLGIKKLWTPAIHMPRTASRIILEVTGVRVERLRAISEADAKAEGAPAADLVSGRECIFPHQGTHRWGFQLLWQSINGLESWDKNPWVWVLQFRRAA